MGEKMGTGTGKCRDGDIVMTREEGGSGWVSLPSHLQHLGSLAGSGLCAGISGCL